MRLHFPWLFPDDEGFPMQNSYAHARTTRRGPLCALESAFAGVP